MSKTELETPYHFSLSKLLPPLSFPFSEKGITDSPTQLLSQFSLIQSTLFIPSATPLLQAFIASHLDYCNILSMIARITLLLFKIFISCSLWILFCIHFDFLKYCIKISFILFIESFAASLNWGHTKQVLHPLVPTLLLTFSLSYCNLFPISKDSQLKYISHHATFLLKILQ